MTNKSFEQQFADILDQRRLDIATLKQLLADHIALFKRSEEQMMAHITAIEIRLADHERRVIELEASLKAHIDPDPDDLPHPMYNAP